MRKSILLIALSMFLLTGLYHCGGSVTHGVQGEDLVDGDISGDTWSGYDLQRVANHMASSIMQNRILNRLADANPRPRWVLAKELEIANVSDHIDTRGVMVKVRTQLIKKGFATFVDDAAIKDILTQLSLQQSALYDTSKATKIGKLVGARLILRGRISEIKKSNSDASLLFYNITMQVVDIQTSEIVWTDEKEIARKWDKPSFR